MTRGLVLGAFGGVYALAAAFGAAQQGRSGPGGGQQAPSADAIQAEKIRNNLYVLRGGGRIVQIGGVNVPQAGTTAAFITANGVVLVDTKLPGWGKPIIDKLKEITDKPVTTIINTHTHMDHVGGNVEFPPTVEVVTHENTAKLMQEMRQVTGGPVQPNIFKDNNGRGLPSRTFSDRVTLGSGNDRIDLYYFGRAHTGGDAWVVFPALRVLHAGDAFPGKGVPPLDANNGASGIEYPETIAKAIAALKDIDAVITGHYQTALTMADLRTFSEFTREFVQAVQAAKRAGRTIDDFVNTWKIPERFVKEGYASTEHLRPIRPDVEVIWNETK
jgi:glyoxylase-like metal-dependent hydrolase (beta-lactamase superfamily II)